MPIGWSEVTYPEEVRCLWCERVCKLGGAYGVKEIGWEVEEGGYFMLEDGWYEELLFNSNNRWW
jgi:hypothetical protein